MTTDGPHPVRAALGLGSNLGDRHAHLVGAIEQLRSTPDVQVVLVSPFVESSPVGGPEQSDYLNAVVVVQTVLAPEELLQLAHSCESSAERVRAERWGPRTLDVDVLAYDDVSRDDPDLTLPHPRAAERGFVLLPWAAVDPDFELEGRSVSERAAEWVAENDRDGGDSVRWVDGPPA